MKARGPVFTVVTLFMVSLLALPADVAAQGGQAAGKITLVVPTAYVVRASQQLTAANSTPVMWGDVVNTGHLARARIALTDGSILNVGSDSNLTIAKHDAGAQQTDLDLNYGRVRAKAVKLVKPDSHFQIRTSVGVAGVVGTEMIVGFEASPSPNTTPTASIPSLKPVPGTLGDAYAAEVSLPQNPLAANDFRQMTLLCLEGTCKLCDNQANCVLMKGGQISTIRGNSSPSQPVAPPPATLSAMVNQVKVTPPPAVAPAAPGGLLAAGAAAGGAAVATVVVRTVAKTTTCPTPTPTTGAATSRPNATCTTIVRGGAIPGQPR